MKRWALRICLLLVLGAIVNVAVAWGCTLWINPWKGTLIRAHRSAPANARQIDPEYKSLTVVRASRSGATDIEVTWRRNTFYPHVDESPLSLVPAWTGLHEPSATFNAAAAFNPYTGTQWMRGGVAVEITIVEIRGWPMAALWTSHANTVPRGHTQTRYGLRTAWTRRTPVINGAPYRIALPLQTIWPGFAINTLFYAGILWLLFAALFALRRRRRIKRGLCPACAYPIGGSDVCTECGAVVSTRPSFR